MSKDIDCATPDKLTADSKNTPKSERELHLKPTLIQAVQKKIYFSVTEELHAREANLFEYSYQTPERQTAGSSKRGSTQS